MTARSSVSWRARAPRIPSGCSSHRRVLPSMSVKRKVTVPSGRAGMDFLTSRGRIISSYPVPELHSASTGGDCARTVEQCVFEFRHAPGLREQHLHDAGLVSDFRDSRMSGFVNDLEKLIQGCIVG